MPANGAADQPSASVVLTCCECGYTFEPSTEDFAVGRIGCAGCGGWATWAQLVGRGEQ